MARGKTEAAASKLKTATGLGALGGSIAGPIGAGVGAVTGLVIGDDTTVFPIDMIAIPAYQAYLIDRTPAFTVYIKAGETLVPTGGNVLDMSENMDIETADEMSQPKKRRRKGAGLPKKYAKMGFKKGWAAYNKTPKRIAAKKKAKKKKTTRGRK